jgi:hypothetical protein
MHVLRASKNFEPVLRGWDRGCHSRFDLVGGLQHTDARNEGIEVRPEANVVQRDIARVAIIEVARYDGVL